jgi:hypothetical protein
MSYKKLLMTTKILDSDIIQIFLPYLINKIQFDDRKDNDITIFNIINHQNISKNTLIYILKNMLLEKAISINDINYIINTYSKYELKIEEIID